MVLLLEYFFQTKRALEKWKGRNKIPTCVRRSSHSIVEKPIPETPSCILYTKPHRTLCNLKEDIKEQPTSRNLSATATRVL